jgi:FAD/FMN-containing dehydrogenase
MSMIVIEHFHGAASRVPVSATACTMRVTGYNVVVISQWLNPAETERGMLWARQTHAALKPYHSAMRYLNYLEADAEDPATVAYGANLPRLREIKKKYDPDNFFRHNVNISPA